MYKYENVKITDDNIHFENSCKLPKRDIKVIVDNLVCDYPENNVIKHRTKYSMLSEIYVHKFCYKLNLYRDRTCSADVNYPINKYAELVYKILGPLCWIFIK